MASGRPIEDELLAAAVSLQRSPTVEWDARDLMEALERALAEDVKLFTVQRNLRRFVRNGWVTEHQARADGPGRPRKLYRLQPEGIRRARDAAARLLGAGAGWAAEPIGIALRLEPPGARNG